ncbi:hypothetical protein Ancab_009794 [Ancistrocladus abbreviatus]
MHSGLISRRMVATLEKIILAAHLDPSLWHPRRQPGPFSTTTKGPLSKTSWRLQAEAKGFIGSSAQQKKAKQKQIVSPTKLDSTNEDDNNDKIPQVVFERMIGRILAYVGVPIAVGLGMLQVFNILKEKQLWDVPLWVPFLTTFLTFGTSALGVAFGTLSTSWDAQKKGSLLGLEEAQQNWAEIWKEEDEGNKKS